MFITVLLLLAVTALPGYALTRVLDGSADALRKAMLTPALGLLIVFGFSGALMYTGLWTWNLMAAGLLLLNTASLAHIQRRTSEKRTLTPWQALEAAMHGEVTSSEDTKLSEEVTAQRWFQSHRKPLPFMVALIAVLSCLTLPFLQTLPFGVDWIGFSMLSGQIHATGTMALPGTNEGFWTYPPAFPSLAAWLQGALGLSSGEAVFQLGHYSLFALLLGIGGAMDRHGAGAHGILAMAFGAGLFAKTFDSGYPTVASQLGLVVGLLVLLRPSGTRGKHHTRGFILAFFCVALIHPTGAIYLGMLMAAHLFIGLRLDEKYGANMQKILISSATLLTGAAAIALLILAPRMLDAAVFAEYGWQGGRPMITYNLVLLAGGLIAAWRLRKSVEGMLLTSWFAGLWLLSGIHLIEGLEQIPILSLLSYVLYSMGLHAFHIPLAALLALLWSDTTNLTAVDQKRGFMGVGWDPHFHKHVATTLLTGVILGVLIGNVLLVQVSEHDELRPVAQGDLKLLPDIKALPDGSVIFSENAQWGYILDAPAHVKFTSLPTLGLVQMESSIQPQATSAVFGDDAEAIQNLNITHAVSSPIGTAGWYLGHSTFWTKLVEYDGSALWAFDSTGQSHSVEFTGFEEDTCAEGCTMRVEPWNEHRFRDPFNLGDHRPFIEHSNGSVLGFSTDSWSQQNGTLCMVYEAIGDVGPFSISVSDAQDPMFSSSGAKAGWHSDCIGFYSLEGHTDEIHIDWVGSDASSQRWINPIGFSGRGDALYDRVGLRFHWLELRPLA